MRRDIIRYLCEFVQSCRASVYLFDSVLSIHESPVKKKRRRMSKVKIDVEGFVKDEHANRETVNELVDDLCNKWADGTVFYVSADYRSQKLRLFRSAFNQVLLNRNGICPSLVMFGVKNTRLHRLNANHCMFHWFNTTSDREDALAVILEP